MYIQVCNFYSLYTKEIAWKSEWFQKGKGYWFHKDNQRLFLQKFAQQMNIENPSDWGRIRLHELLERGALPLYMMHEGSIFKLLKNVFPGILLSQVVF